MTNLNHSVSDLFASDEDIAEYRNLREVIKINHYPGFTEIDSEIIMKAWMQFMKYPKNDYDGVVRKAAFFSRHGLTPVFYGNEASTLLFVTSEELMQGKMH